ncbi:MAG TPA: DUF6159 family protein [Solirubrobacterales bacterium]|nr:DUF6159 family protein [Solirubrobacterales bacterium]
MDASLQELRPYAGEPRASSGWRLAKAGWRLLRRDRTLRILTVLAFLAAALPTAVGVYGSGHLWGSAPFTTNLAVNAVALVLLTFVLVAIASAVDGAVDGMPLEPGEALADARECLVPVLGWAAISLTLWVASWLVARTTSSLWPVVPISLAWYVVGLFVVPAIAIERVGVVEALRETLHLTGERWRQSCGGLLGIGVFTAIALIVPSTMLSRASELHRAGNGTDHLLVYSALALLFLVLTIGNVAREAFGVLLLREALDDLPGREYAGRRLRRRAKVGRVLGATALVFALLALAGAVNRDARRTLDAANSPGATYEIVVANPEHVDLPSGSAVFYRGGKVGTILGSHEEDSGLSITFHVEPGIGPESTPGSFRIVRSRALGPILVLTPSSGGSGGTEIHPA